MTKLVLASQSPRRRELLAELGLPFEVKVSRVNEDQRSGEAPEAYARRLSQEKAQSVAAMLDYPALVVAADTIVVDNGEVLGKPGSTDEAIAMLRRLRGRTHTVITAVTVLDTASAQMISEAPASWVTMRDYSDEEIAGYITTGDPMDKAGAYAIQHPEFRPVVGFDHCFANVMGLPICRVARILEQLGLKLSAEAKARCAVHLEYPCPIYDQ